MKLATLVIGIFIIAALGSCNNSKMEKTKEGTQVDLSNKSSAQNYQEPKTISVNSFYIDESEVSSMEYSYYSTCKGELLSRIASDKK